MSHNPRWPGSGCHCQDETLKNALIAPVGKGENRAVRSSCFPVGSAEGLVALSRRLLLWRRNQTYAYCLAMANPSWTHRLRCPPGCDIVRRETDSCTGQKSQVVGATSERCRHAACKKAGKRPPPLTARGRPYLQASVPDQYPSIGCCPQGVRLCGLAPSKARYVLNLYGLVARRHPPSIFRISHISGLRPLENEP